MFAITVVAGIASLRDRTHRRASWTARAWIVWLGVSDAFNVLLFLMAYKITIGVSVLAHYLTPVFVAIASPLVLRERLSRKALGAVAVSVAGLGVMMSPRGHEGASSAVWTSAALGAASAVFYAANVIANKFVADDFSTSEAIFWHGLVATPLLASFVPPAAFGAADPRAVGFLAAIALWPGGVAGLAFLWGLRRMPAAHASTLTLLEPLVAVLVGAAVFGESLGLQALLGGGLILGGALVVIREPREPRAALRSAGDVGSPAMAPERETIG
jgi:drug/metabolite transporter (DMT)-like permease